MRVTLTIDQMNHRDIAMRDEAYPSGGDRLAASRRPP
jgi:hypothetical protein